MPATLTCPTLNLSAGSEALRCSDGEATSMPGTDPILASTSDEKVSPLSLVTLRSTLPEAVSRLFWNVAKNDGSRLLLPKSTATPRTPPGVVRAGRRLRPHG